MTHTPEAIAAEIKSWNLSDVRTLRDLLAELSNCRDEHGDRIDVEAYIDTTRLPSAPIPAEIDTGYPVWAVDVQGVALVGDDMRSIEHIDQIRARPMTKAMIRAAFSQIDADLGKMFQQISYENRAAAHAAHVAEVSADGRNGRCRAEWARVRSEAAEAMSSEYKKLRASCTEAKRRMGVELGCGGWEDVRDQPDEECVQDMLTQARARLG